MPAKEQKQNEQNKQNKTEDFNNCETVKSLADEYFHNDPDLTEIDRESICAHLKTCDGCSAFYAGEKKYLDEIKAAEYIPGISISEAVMNNIIENTLIVDSGPKKRIVPFGLISAAAVVIVMFALSRAGLLDTLNRVSNDSNYSNDSANNMIMHETAENQAIDYGELLDGVYSFDYGLDADAGGYFEENEADETNEANEENEEKGEYEAADDINTAADKAPEVYAYNMPAATESLMFAPEPAETPAPALRMEAETAEAMGGGMEIAEPETEEIDKNETKNIEVSQTIWAVTDNQGNIFNGIEIVETRDDGRLFIIHSKDTEAVINNLIKEDIIYKINDESGGNPEYIAVRLQLAYPTEN